MTKKTHKVEFTATGENDDYAIELQQTLDGPFSNAELFKRALHLTSQFYDALTEAVLKQIEKQRLQTKN